MTDPVELAQLAHDLRNRFNQILVLAECASLLQGPKMHDALRAIQDAALNGGATVGRLMGQAHQAASLLEVDEAILPIVDGLRALARNTVAVRVEPGATGHAIRMEPDQLADVLLNLVRNACDAMPDGGVLTIRTGTLASATIDPHVFIEVADTGCGIPPDLLPRIFTPYVSAKRGQGGTGLGLSSVRTVIERAGGAVLVQSTLGEGTVFRLEIPSVPWPDAAGGGNGRVILLVDDDRPQCQAAALHLNRADWRVQIAGTMTEALAVLRSPGPLHLMITDVGLPDGTGWDLIDQARTVSAALPVIVASGYGPDPVHRPGVHHLTKPFSCRRLVQLAADVALCPAVPA